MPNTFDFYPFTGGISIKVNGDDGNDVPSGIWKIETRGNILEIKHVVTDRVLHTITVGTDTAKISGGANITDATALKTALQAVFFKAITGTGGTGNATSLDTVPDGLERFALTSEMNDYLLTQMSINTTE